MNNPEASNGVSIINNLLIEADFVELNPNHGIKPGLTKYVTKTIRNFMQIADMKENELIALAGLAKYVLMSDKILTPEENMKLEALTEMIGAEQFRLLLDKFEQKCSTPEEFRNYLKSIESQDSREAIYRVIFDLATVDSVDQVETNILSWLESEWQIKIGYDAGDVGKADE